MFIRNHLARRRSERGSILAMATIGMVSFLLAVGLCIDIGRLYLVGTELQNAADAAALAGASALNNGAGGITRAVDRAVATMNNYDFNHTGVTIDRTSVRFAVNLSDFSNDGTGLSEAQAAASPSNIRFVRVTIPPKSIGVIFATIALESGMVDMSRQAVAGMSVALNYFCNIAPLSVVEDDLTNQPLDIYGSCGNTTQFTPGCTYVIRSASGKGNSGSISAGNYMVLAIGSDRGGSDTKFRLALGSESCFSLGQEVSTEPGIEAGPVRFGINTRFDQYGGGLSASEFPPDTNIKQGITYAQYSSGSGDHIVTPSHTGIPDRRVIVIPIIRLSEFDSGRNTVTINRFGVFFLQTPVDNGNGGDIRAEFVSENVAVGDGGYNPNGGVNPSVNLTVPVLYR